MMKSNKTKKVMIILLAFLIVALATGCGGGDAGASLKEGDAAPDFEAELAGGGTFSLSEAAGKVTIINFWATWCPPCCEEMPAFERLYEEYGDQLNIVAVDYSESKDLVDDFIAENGYTFPIAYDEEGNVSNLYPSNGIPYTVIVDEQGIITKTFVGAANADEQYKLYKEAVEEEMND